MRGINTKCIGWFSVVLLSCSLAFSAPPDKSGVRPSALSLPSGPGSIEGLGKSFQPHINSGTATYGVPLKVPPGTAGFAPEVELAYNSGGGNSAFGQGWACSPELSIERQTEKGFPRFRDVDNGTQLRDVFLFHGEELVPLSDGTFRCENETEFRRFRPLASQGSAIDSWLVEDRNGTKHWLGRYLGNAPNGGNSRVVHISPPQDGLGARTPSEQCFQWKEDAAQDVNGNRIEFDYVTDSSSPGELYLDQIRYFARGNASSYHLVKFYHSSRPDQPSDNRAGFPRVIGLRCREIGVFSFYANQLHPVRSFVLNYDPSDGALGDIDTGSPFLQRRVNLGLSYLYAITEFDSTRRPGGAGAVGNMFPPVRFAYSGFYVQAPPAGVLQTLAPLAYRLRAWEADPLALGPVQGSLRQSKDPDGGGLGSLFFDALLENAHVQFADMNGDGLPDLLNTETDQTHPLYQVAYNYGNGVFRTSTPVTSSPVTVNLADESPQNAVTLTDINGDGITDLVQIVNDGNGLKTRIYQNRYDPARADGPTGFASAPTPDATTPFEISLSSPNVRQMDINFDKRPDVLVCNQQGIVGYRSNPGGGWTDLGRQDWSQFNGDGKIPITYSFSRTDPPLAERPNPLVFLADMNGDRLLDLVQVVVGIDGQAVVNYRPLVGPMLWGPEITFQFALSDGTPSGSPAALSMPGLLSNPLDSKNNWGSIQMLDVNGDGLTDIVYVQQNQSIRVFFNCGGKAFLGPYQVAGTPIYDPYNESNPTILRAVDINGNGSTDLVFYHASGGNDRVGFRYMDFVSGQKPGLLQVIDNGIGRRTFIRYRSATEDLIRGRKTGHPWLTTIPNQVWVVSGMVDDIGLDLNGDGAPDRYATSFDYRDGYYDGFEKQFRGFAYAQKISWGDDVNASTGLPTGNGLGQVGTPTGVTRYRFMTGSPDGADNDQYVAGFDIEPQPISATVDEISILGGREEESLKGKPVWEEAIDGAALIDPAADFDVCADGTGHAARSGEPYGAGASHCTTNTYVYSRTFSQWAVRRLYRPSGVVAPKGRLLIDEPSTVCQVGKSVTFPVLLGTITETIEANELLKQKFSHANAPVATQGPVVASKELDYDNFGNPVIEQDNGIVSGLSQLPDDEKVTRRAFILTRGGAGSIDNWMINRVQWERVEDENGIFASESRHYYDGADFAGLPLGQLGTRGLETCTEHRVSDPNYSSPPIDLPPTSPALLDAIKVPSDPRGITPEWINTSRKAFDQFGNTVWMMDPLGQLAGGSANTSYGHVRRLVYDPIFQTFPTEEHIYVGGGQAELVMSAEYQRTATATGPEVPWGFGVMTRSIDFNGNSTDYFYDSFARLTAIVKPGDSELLPTGLFSYKPADPQRGIIYSYDRSGSLTLGSGSVLGLASSVQTDAREVAGQAGVFTTINYTDANGNKLLSLEEDEKPGQFVVKESTRYGLRGNPLYRFQPFRQISGGFMLPDLTLPRSDFCADALGRIIRTVLPPETETDLNDRRETRTHHLPFTEYLFDEEDIASSDPAQPHLNTPMIHHKDGLGRLIGVDETVRNAGDGSGVGPLQVWQTRYVYDLNNKLVHIRDSQNNEKWFRFDGLGRKTFMNDMDRGVMFYVYDNASNFRSTTDAKAQTIFYGYDGLNRLVTEHYRPTNQLPDVTYHYDVAYPNLPIGDGTVATANNTKGMLSWVEDLSGEEHTSYDARERVEFVVKRIPDPQFLSMNNSESSSQQLVSYRSSFAYDSMNRITTLTYADNDQVDYRYNSRNLVAQILGGPSHNIISNITYQSSAQLKCINYGNGTSSIYTYDTRLRLSTMATFQTSAPNNPFISFAYTLDGASNIRAIADQRSVSIVPAWNSRRNSQFFKYDDTFRLNQVQYSFSPPGSQLSNNNEEINYRYDQIGNMKAQTSTIAHFQNGLSVTDIGSMIYGGSTGTSARIGRDAPDPGPHAITSISPLSTNGSQPRVYAYDANGNMTLVDGLTNSWDFKDRLVAVENAEMRSVYTYDYADRRIFKTVWSKSPTNSELTWVVYPDKYFEVREHEAPTKFIWMGNTRVARVTGSLNTNQRLQRIRAYTGWNLCSLAVTANNALQQISQSGQNLNGQGSVVQSAFKWNPVTFDWVKVTTGETLPSGTVLWLQANTNATLTVTGTYVEPTNHYVNVTGAFFPSAGLEAWNIVSTLSMQTSISVWIYDPSLSHWRSWLPPPLELQSDLPPVTTPGQAIFARSDIPAQLAIPKSSLRILYYHGDHLGSPSAMTDSLGTVIQDFAYYPFGWPRVEFRVGSTKEDYTFTDKERDGESHLYYCEARYLSAPLARFITVDPLVSDFSSDWLTNPQKLNSYSYGFNNPLRFTDPSGKAGVDIANWWQARVDTAAQFYSAAPENWGWNGTVATLDTMIGGAADPLRLGTDAGKIIFEGGTPWQAAGATVHEGLRVISVIPAGIAFSKMAGPALQRILPGAPVAAKGLTPEIAATFSGGKYTSTVLQESMTAYRYSGGVSGATSRFLTTADTIGQISSPAAASIALKLPVGATAETLNTFTIPAGTRIFTGGVAGGADTATQIFLENPGVLIPH